MQWLESELSFLKAVFKVSSNRPIYDGLYLLDYYWLPLKQVEISEDLEKFGSAKF